MNEKHQITQAAELDSLTIFRRFIREVCEGTPNVDDQTLYDLQLAVDEACTNIITHGYAGMNPGSIILNLDLQPAQIVMTLTDFGRPFEPYEPPAPDARAVIEDPDTVEFGLFFIYQTMDDIGYETTLDCNRLTLVKRLPPDQQE